MSTLEKRKTRLRFETSTSFRGRAVVAEAEPFYLNLRLKGTRTQFAVPWDAIYTLGAKLKARQNAEAKRLNHQS